MPRFVPKTLPDEDWKQIAPRRPHAVLANPEDIIYVRLGMGKSLYLELVPSQMGARVISLLSYESGDTILMRNLVNQGEIVVGRGHECAIKIMNPIISRRHVRFELDGNVLLLEDEGSSNGTFLHPDNFCFDIDAYLVDRPVETAQERTLDSIHEVFGPNLDDFLKRYSLKRKESPS